LKAAAASAEIAVAESAPIGGNAAANPALAPEAPLRAVAVFIEGGYQTWVCGHSRLEPGTGEAMVEAALALLREALGREGRKL
jgi:hypothetical protein